jgi:hypothetical protein
MGTEKAKAGAVGCRDVCVWGGDDVGQRVCQACRQKEQSDGFGIDLCPAGCAQSADVVAIGGVGRRCSLNSALKGKESDVTAFEFEVGESDYHQA